MELDPGAELGRASSASGGPGQLLDPEPAQVEGEQHPGGHHVGQTVEELTLLTMVRDGPSRQRLKLAGPVTGRARPSSSRMATKLAQVSTRAAPTRISP
jgi:hypothetical protein